MKYDRGTVRALADIQLDRVGALGQSEAKSGDGVFRSEATCPAVPDDRSRSRIEENVHSSSNPMICRYFAMCGTRTNERGLRYSVNA